MKVQLIYFTGCPNVELTREVVKEAIADQEVVEVEEIDTKNHRAPRWAHAWGSPTILVNGRDVAGEEPSAGCCRLYDDHHPESRGVPSLDVVRTAIQEGAVGFVVAAAVGIARPRMTSYRLIPSEKTRILKGSCRPIVDIEFRHLRLWLGAHWT